MTIYRLWYRGECVGDADLAPFPRQPHVLTGAFRPSAAFEQIWPAFLRLQNANDALMAALAVSIKASPTEDVGDGWRPPNTDQEREAIRRAYDAIAELELSVTDASANPASDMRIMVRRLGLRATLMLIPTSRVP